MKNSKRLTRKKYPFLAGMVVFMLPMLAQTLRAQPVVRHPEAGAPLAQRWAWAEQQARKEYPRQGCWIGYSIQRLMPLNSFIGSMHIEDDCIRLDGPSLSELINGTPSPDSLPPCGKKSSRSAEREVLKEVGFFFRFSPSRNEFSEIKVSTFSLAIEFEDRPILWLGRVPSAESMSWLKQFYRKTSSRQTKEDLMGVIGTHELSVERQAFLTEVLKSQEDDDVRKQAAFYLGQNADRATIALLKETAQRDRANEVRKQAVFALTQTKSEDASAALADLAKHAPHFEIRKEALFWLAQTHSATAVTTLKEVLRQDDHELQKQAVFAITQLPKAQSVPLLVEVAKNHAKPEIRKEALFWLAQTHSEQAVAVLKEVVLRDDFEVQKHAVFAITQLSQEQSMPLLIEVAQNHPKQEIRKEALFWLAQTHSKQVVPVLKEAVQKDEYEVQKHAVFAVSQLPRSEGTPLLIDIAKTHPNHQIRKEALFWLGQSDDPRAAEALIKIVRGK